MFTPQEIQEQTFSKAVFGGYDMQQVDDFLEPLTEDYIALYKENSVLKSKMKILVEKLEEYRGQEAAMKKAMADAQSKCDRMLAEARAQCNAMVQSAEDSAAKQHIEDSISEEQERLNCAKQTALNFIEVIEGDIRGHLDLLEQLKHRDLKAEQAPKKPEPPKHAKPYDWQADSKPSLVVDTSSRHTQDIADEISENLEKLVGSEPEPDVKVAPAKPAAPSHPDSATIKFENLKFGKNYDPTRES